MKTIIQSGSIRTRQHGLTLVEIMVALAISLFLLSGVVYAYLSNRTTYVFNEEMSRLQENGRMVMNMLDHEIRRASHVGCARLEKVRANGLDTLKTNLERGLGAKTRGGLAVSGGPGITVAAADNFELRIFGSSGYDMELAGDVAEGDNKIEMIANVVGAQSNSGDYFLVGNCSEADLFKAGSVTGQFAATTTVGLSVPAALPEYKTEESSVFWMGPSMEGAPWFIKDNGRRDIAGRPILALVRGVEGAAAGSNPIEIVEGVEAFRICVGQDPSRTGAISGKYVRADKILPGDEKDVTAVQVDLVLVSQMPNILDEARTQTFELCGGTDPYVSPRDRRLRKLFSTTVMLRNKLP
jgi:type IV pilus assembly protein PilW